MELNISQHLCLTRIHLPRFYYIGRQWFETVSYTHLDVYKRQVHIQIQFLLLFRPHLDNVRVIRIDKPHGRRIVVPALEVVQPRLYILIVPFVPDRVLLIK